jgi:hypothetical protein
VRSPAPAVRIPLVSEAPRAKSTPTNGATSESLIWSPASTDSAFRPYPIQDRSGHRSRCRARSGWCWLEADLVMRTQFTIEPLRREESTSSTARPRRCDGSNSLPAAQDSSVILRHVLEGVLLIGPRVNICSIFGAIYSETDLFLSRRRA